MGSNPCLTVNNIELFKNQEKKNILKGHNFYFFYISSMVFRVLIAVCLAATLFFAVKIGIGVWEHSNREPVERVAIEPVETIPETPIEPSKPVRRFTNDDVHRLLLSRTHQKKEIYLEQLRPELDTAGIVVVSVFHEVMGDDYIPWITSGNDYEHHKKTSAHYRNMALDFRLKGIPMYKKRAITAKAKSTLGRRFFVQHEFPGGEMEHLHIELRDEKRNWAY